MRKPLPEKETDHGADIVAAPGNTAASLTFYGGEIDDTPSGGICIEAANLVTIDNIEIIRSTNPGTMPTGIKLGAVGSADIRVPRFRIDYAAPFTGITISSGSRGIRITNPLFYIQAGQNKYNDSGVGTNIIEGNMCIKPAACN